MQETSNTNHDPASLEREVINLTKLVSINSIINSTLDIARLLTIIMEIIKEIMDTEASTLLLYEESSRDLVFKVALGEAGKELTEKYRVKLGQGIAGWVAEQRKPLLVNDAYQDRRFDPMFDHMTGFITRAILCVPLLYKGRLLGVIQAINPLQKQGFGTEDQRLFMVFAEQASLAVQNAIYFQNALEEERIRSELASARAIQDSLVPDINEIAGNVRISARSVSAREIGGEFHSIFRTGGGMIGVALGDIHEKGIPGGLHASMVSGALRSLSHLKGDSPLGIVRTLDRVMEGQTAVSGKASIFYGVVDPAARSLRFVNSGIAYPILVRNNRAHYLRFGAAPGDDSAVKLVSVRLEPGDFFVIISDGIIKLKNSGGKQLGLNRIMKFLQGDFLNPEYVIESMLAFAAEYVGDVGVREDVSIIVFSVD
jgi:phosphoserine phosphatase RsbU/P